MNTMILATDGGAHSAEDWANITADMLLASLRVKDDSPRMAQIEAAKARAKTRLVNLLGVHHQRAQTAERDLIKAGSNRPLDDSDLSGHAKIDEAIAEVRKAIQPVLDEVRSVEVLPAFAGAQIDNTNFEVMLRRVIRERIEMDLRSVVFIERSWHADRASL